MPGRKIKIGNFEAQILKHSVTSCGLEAITYQATHERFGHADWMTHRWSRSASSSRAKPYDDMIAWIDQDPAMHLHLGVNRSGMQSGGESEYADAAEQEILEMYREVRGRCNQIRSKYNLHKEILNRYTEPWGWITVVATTGRDQFMNYLTLRAHYAAAPNVQREAVCLARLYRESTPQKLRAGQWHTPYFDDYIPDDKFFLRLPRRFQFNPKIQPETKTALVWSSARCAWVSYNSPTKSATWEKALKRHDENVEFKHASPLEHQLRARGDRGKSGLVPGYDSYRSMIPGESSKEFDFNLLDTVYKDRDYEVRT